MSPAAPAFSRTCLAVARELSAAPFLPGIEESPPAVIEEGGADQAKKPEYTGKIVLRDEDRCLRVGAMRLLGYSDRAIARELGMSHHSIPLIIEHLEEQGKLEPVRARLLAHVGRLSEQAALATSDLLGRLVECPSSDLASSVRAAANVLDVASEKHALLTGQPTNISAVVQAGPSREEWDRWVRDQVIEVEAGPAPDSQSGEECPIPSGNGGLQGGDTVDATAGPPDPGGPGSGGNQAAGEPAPGAGDPGGGVRARVGSRDDR